MPVYTRVTDELDVHGLHRLVESSQRNSSGSHQRGSHEPPRRLSVIKKVLRSVRKQASNCLQTLHPIVCSLINCLMCVGILQ